MDSPDTQENNKDGIEFLKKRYMRWIMPILMFVMMGWMYRWSMMAQSWWYMFFAMSAMMVFGYFVMKK